MRGAALLKGQGGESLMKPSPLPDDNFFGILFGPTSH